MCLKLTDYLHPNDVSPSRAEAVEAYCIVWTGSLILMIHRKGRDKRLSTVGCLLNGILWSLRRSSHSSALLLHLRGLNDWRVPLYPDYLKTPSHALALNIGFFVMLTHVPLMLLSYTFLFVRGLSMVSEGQEKILNFFPDTPDSLGILSTWLST